MAPITLYAHPQSAYCRYVTLTLDVLGLEYEYKLVDLFTGENRKPEYVKMNVQHNVPFLIDGDFMLNECQAIMVYLVEKYGNNSHWYPTDAKDLETRTRINQRLCFSQQVLMDAFGQTFRPVAFQGENDIAPAKLDRLKEVLGFLQHFLKSTGFVAETKEASLADLACLAAYTTIVTTKDALVNLADYPDVAEWAEKIKKLVPHYEEVNGKGVKVFEEFFKTRVLPKLA